MDSRSNPIISDEAGDGERGRVLPRGRPLGICSAPQVPLLVDFFLSFFLRNHQHHVMFSCMQLAQLM